MISDIYEELEFNVDVYKPFIIEHVKFSHLSSIDCIKVHASKLYKLDRDGKYREAGELFLSVLKKSDDHQKWQQFRVALQQEGYEHVLKLLEGDIGYENHDEKRKIIELFQQNIAQNIDARELCDAFKGKDILSAVEEEEIFQIAENHGNISASIYLLDHIWKKKVRWYEDFLRVLIDLDRTEVARMIDPDFVEKRLACQREEFKIEKELQDDTSSIPQNNLDKTLTSIEENNYQWPSDKYENKSQEMMDHNDKKPKYNNNPRHVSNRNLQMTSSAPSKPSNQLLCNGKITSNHLSSEMIPFQKEDGTVELHTSNGSKKRLLSSTPSGNMDGVFVTHNFGNDERNEVPTKTQATEISGNCIDCARTREEIRMLKSEIQEMKSSMQEMNKLLNKLVLVTQSHRK